MTGFVVDEVRIQEEVLKVSREKKLHNLKIFTKKKKEGMKKDEQISKLT